MSLYSGPIKKINTVGPGWTAGMEQSDQNLQYLLTSFFLLLC